MKCAQYYKKAMLVAKIGLASGVDIRYRQRSDIQDGLGWTKATLLWMEAKTKLALDQSPAIGRRTFAIVVLFPSSLDT